MAVYDILPNTNLRYDDIRDTLNANGGSVTNEFSTAFKNGNINKWSKHKPVRLNRDFCQDFDPSRLSYIKDWWKAGDYNCGMRMGVQKTPDGNITNMTQNINDVEFADWFYQRPLGMASSPYRLGDFCGYNPHAYSVIGSGLPKNITINKFENGVYNIEFMTIIDSSDDNLQINDFNISLNGYHYAAAIKGGGTNGFWREYRGGLIGGVGVGVSIDSASLTNGVYTLALFLANAPDVGAGDYLPLPKDEENATWITATVVTKAPFEFDFRYISKSLNGPYIHIDDLEAPYELPGSGRLYFKGVFRCQTPSSRFIQVTNLRGQSDSFHGGTTIDGLNNKVYDANKKVISSIDMSGMAQGQTREIYVEWNGFTGNSEPGGGIVIGGSLDMLYVYGQVGSQYMYVGGSPGFEVMSY